MLLNIWYYQKSGYYSLNELDMIVQFSIKRVFRILFLRIQTMSIWPSSLRNIMMRIGGVKIGKTLYDGGQFV